jgi:hypothetical protein
LCVLDRDYILIVVQQGPPGTKKIYNIEYNLNYLKILVSLKIHKIENFFGSDFECCVISLLF